jgi:hypothetical protein
MKNKNAHSAKENNQQHKTAGSKKQPAINIDSSRATDNVKPKAGRGLANEGTNVSYEEER